MTKNATYHSALGYAIKQGRQAVGMTQQQMAWATGANLRTIQRLEAGTTATRPWTLFRVACILDNG